MREGAVREGDCYQTMARRYPLRAVVPQTRSLSPFQHSKAMVAPTTEAWSGNPLSSVDLSIRPSLHQILEQPEQFFHMSQQSAKMCIEHNRRTLLSNELKRRADIQHYREYTMKPTTLRQVGKKTITQAAVDVERVTLTMEVTYSDYEEMFTKRILNGTTESCANIMMETNTIIQFPDRDEPTPDFMHQASFFFVTITGNLTDVEEARIRLRKFCPVVLMFAVSETLREGVPVTRLSYWLKEKIEDGSINFPNLNIQVLPHSLSTTFKDPVIRVSGRVGDEQLLLQACECLRDLLFVPEVADKDPVIRVSGRVGDEQLLLQACERLRDLLFVPEVADKISFSTHMEVPAAQRSQLVGTPDGAQLLVISRVTKALLHFPSHSDEASQTLFFYFTGQPESILKARRYVQGLLPMQLCFHAGSEDLRARIDPENRLIKFYDEVLRVSVRVVPSDLESLSMLPGDQMRHFISLRTSEYNVGALYAVMRRVLKRGDEIPMVKPTDYAEMLPLVPDLIKHACEVNVKCRLEPGAFDLGTLSPILTPMPPMHTTNSSQSLSTEAADQSSFDADFPASSEVGLSQYKESIATFNRNACLDNSFDTTSSVHSSRNDNEITTRGTTSVNRSRHSSPRHYYPNKHYNRYNGSDKENLTREKGSYIAFNRSRNYHSEGRGSSFRTYRFGGSNSAHMKHHLALRSRDGEASRAGDNRYQRCSSELPIELSPRLCVVEFNNFRKGNQLHHVAERASHGGLERRGGCDWRGSQQAKLPESSANHTISSKTVLSQRPRNGKIELQRRVKDETPDDDQEKENLHHSSNRRMDVMDLIKLASAEDSERRKSAVEENSCLLDCGDGSATDTLVAGDISDAADVFSTVDSLSSGLSSEKHVQLDESTANARAHQYEVRHLPSNVSDVPLPKKASQYSKAFLATNIPSSLGQLSEDGLVRSTKARYE
ncbi:hypothetical protein ANCCAN_12504 [Ancylostoma caninum]|uniref:Defective in germ line development protein 3-like KH5 domain-containing protein n=1 Tax=Ancylostoma caninum TaxID=29170 RepID=A0A368GAW9_ANCCA|nr:hypothetical protein ANCCAN_12504 [Ancylostoma caninum]